MTERTLDLELTRRQAAPRARECASSRYGANLDPADTQHVSGVILADQLKSADWRARPGILLDQLPNEVVELTVATLSRLLT